VNRRGFLGASLAGGLGAAGVWLWPDEGWINPCPETFLPAHLARHDLVQAAFDGVRADWLWDAHVHVAGTGDGGRGIWLSPQMQSWMHPLQNLQRVFYLNASCADHPGRTDAAFIERLLAQLAAFPAGARVMLLAFDYAHDEHGRRDSAHSAFHIPDSYVAGIARAHAPRFEWLAPIHPWRDDALEALDAAVRAGARGVKWLPSARNIDPASPRCDPFYDALRRAGIPLLTHAGGELAVHGGGAQTLNNPLRLRRPLELGVRTVVAHCASWGEDADLDRGPDGPVRPSFELFARLMDEPGHEGLLFGDISALTQRNRMGVLAEVVRRGDWHPRLVNGSDYPLPGVMPLFSLAALAHAGWLPSAEGEVLSAIRRYNPLLFDFVLKRRLRVAGAGLHPGIFESRRVFDPGRILT